MTTEVNRDNYDSEVLESDLPVLVDFWGPQCGPCLALMPAVEEMGKHYEGRVKVTKVNVTGNRMLCAKLRVMSVPTFIFYRDGVEQNRLVGDDITVKDLEKAVDAIAV